MTTDEGEGAPDSSQGPDVMVAGGVVALLGLITGWDRRPSRVG